MILLSAMPWLRNAGESLLNVVFVPRCGACKVTLPTARLNRLCDACDAATVPNDGARCARCDVPGAPLCERCAVQTPAYDNLRAPWLYGGSTAQLLRASKFAGREDLAAACAQSIAVDREARMLAASCDMLVPVPLGKSRRRSRGYNQSAIIAQVLARAWQIPVQHALRRVRDTQPQSALPLAERAANVQQAFVSKRPLTGAALLIDDVVTSGETVHQAACALKQAGLRYVAVLAVARAPHPTWNQDIHG